MHLLRRTLVLATACLLLSCSSGGGGGGSGGSSTASGSSPGSGAAATPVLRAGAARVDVTPPAGAPLGGFGAPPRRSLDAAMVPWNLAALFGSPYRPYPGAYAQLFEPSAGGHDPVCAKAVVFERAGGERYAVLGVDAIGVSKRARDEIARRAAASGVPSERLLVAATHTHSGPGAIADKAFWQVVAMDLLEPRLYDAFCDGAAQAILDAAARMEPALLAAGSENETSVQRNRRGRGVVDPELSTVGFVRPDGTTIALLVNLAVHGICLGESNMEFTADLMGFCEREVEAQLGAGAVCVYLNGAEGDVSPNDYGWPGAESVGKAIAWHALSIWATAAQSPLADAPLGASYEVFRFRFAPTIDLNRASSGAGGLLGSGGGQVNLSVLALAYGNVPVVFDERMFNRDIPAQAIRLGEVCLIGVPGEPLTNVGLDLKAAARALGFARPIVVGLSNDHVGYIADPTEYDRGGYEAMMTFFGRETSVELSTALLRQVDRVKP